MSPLFPPNIGGIELFTSSISLSLKERGHRVQVLSFRNDQTLPDTKDWNGIAVCRVSFLQGIALRNPAMLLRAQKDIRATVEAFSPDVVHLHVGGPILHAYLGCPAFRGIPLLVTVHDLPDSADQFPTVKSLLQQADWITTNSRIRLDDTVRFQPSARDRAECLYVGKPVVTCSTAVERSQNPLLFMAGRQVMDKGFDLAIDAFAEVHKRHPQAKLVLAGTGPMHETLHRMTEALGLRESVQLLGVVSAEQLAEWLARSWFALVPSRHSESFGLVALEAMQAGRAVLASRFGGLPEVVDDGVTGLLVEPGSASALAQGMERLLKDTEQTFAMGQAGRNRANSLFDWEKCVNGYEEILMRVAKS